MPYGVLDTTNIDFPPNIDVTYVRGLTTPRGVSFATVLAQIDARLRAASAAVDPLVADLVSYTTNPTADGSTPTAFDLEEETEYGLPRPEQAPKRAHMLPFRRYAKSMGFTEQGLEEMTQAELLRQVDNFLATFQRGLVLNVLRRLFSDAEVYVDRKTTSTSPGFAGSGTGDNAFAGTYPDGTALPGGYSHYYRDTVANRAVAIRAARDRLKKWHPGPYDLIGSQSEIDAIVALGEAGGFVKATSDLILRAQGAAAANVNADTYVGVLFDDIRVRVGRNELGTEPNWAVYKTFGPFDARNPLAIRYDEGFGRGIDVRFRSLFPLDQSVMRQRYGVGVANRTAAALGRMAASGPYVAPVIQ